MIRIAIVCHASIGGSGLVATELGLALAERGHEVHFIAQKRPFKLPEGHKNLFFHPVAPIEYPLFNDPLYLFALTAKLTEVIEHYRLDLVHVHYAIPHTLAAHLAQKLCAHAVPVITTLHGTDATVVGLDPNLRRLNEYGLQHSDALTTVSHHHAAHIQNHFDLQAPIEVIYNFIDTQQFSPNRADIAVRRKLACDEEKILMHVSNFRPAKNTQAVVAAFAKVLEVVPSRLVLVGSGPDVEPLKRECERLGIAASVSFLGDITHVEALLAHADCVIQPSVHESFGMVLLEAMASGVPVVASTEGGIPEVVIEGETGLLAPFDDHRAQALAVLKIFQDAPLQQRLGAAGRKRAEQYFSTATQVRCYLDCYRRVLAQWQKKHAQRSASFRSV